MDLKKNIRSPFGAHAVGSIEDDGIIYQAKIAIFKKNVSIEMLRAVPVEDVKRIDNELDLAVNQETIFSVAIPSVQTLARKIQIALTKTKDIEAAFRFELESVLPYPLDMSVTAAVPIEKFASATDILCFAALKKDVEELCDTFSSLGIDSEFVIPKAIALSEFSRSFFPHIEACTIVDIGHSETTVVLLYGGMPHAVRSIQIGLSSLQLPEATKEIEDVAAIHDFLKELGRIFVNFQGVIPESDTMPLLFTGPVVVQEELMQLIEQLLSRSKVLLEIDGGGYAADEICAFAVPIGLALTSAHMGPLFVNLRNENLAYVMPWKRWQKALYAYAVVVALATASIWFLLDQDLDHKQHLAVEQYKNFVAILEKDPQEIEKSMNTDAADVSLSYDALESRVFFAEEHFLHNKETIPLHPDIPRVLDLVIWLCHHPQIVAASKEDARLESLSYSMLKRPEKENPKAKYRIKVDLEFSCQSPHMARDLYNALTTQNPFIDSREEMKWTQARGKYFASFILKDNTKYLESEIDL